MKKIVCCFMVATLLVFISSGCSKNSEKSNLLLNNGEDQLVEEIEIIENISIVLKDNTLLNTGATFKIIDLSGQNNVYDSWFKIEVEKDGKWTYLEPIVDNYAFSSKAYYVDNNNEIEFNVTWKDIYGELKKGKYRLVKKVNNKYIAAEFEII